MPVLAHLSDPHLDGGQEALARVRRVVDHLAGLAQPPDAVLVSGDVSDRGDPADYVAAAELFAEVSAPVWFCPGNHDDRAAFRQGLLGGAPDPSPVNQVHRVAGLTVLSLDSTIPGRSEGALGVETLTWLDEQLAASGPALVAFHHPPAALTLPALDRMGLRDPAGLADVLARHDHVLAVLCGHVHTAAVTTFAGRPLVTAPGVRSTALPPWEVAQRYATSTESPPALAFHIIDDGTLTTHFRAV